VRAVAGGGFDERLHVTLTAVTCFDVIDARIAFFFSPPEKEKGLLISSPRPSPTRSHPPPHHSCSKRRSFFVYASTF